MFNSLQIACRACWPSRAAFRQRIGRRRDRRRRFVRVPGHVQVVGRLQRPPPASKVNYQSIGSGGGIAQIKAGTVDFGSSDAPLKPEELAKSGLAQFPSVIGGVVPVFNVPGVAAGAHEAGRPDSWPTSSWARSRKWNDPRIVAMQRRRQACPTQRSPSCTAPMVPAPPSTSSTTCPRSARHGRARSAKAPRSSGRWASAARATRAWPPTSSRSRAAIGYVELAYALQNKMSVFAHEERCRQLHHPQ